MMKISPRQTHNKPNLNAPCCGRPYTQEQTAAAEGMIRRLVESSSDRPVPPSAAAAAADGVAVQRDAAAAAAASALAIGGLVIGTAPPPPTPRPVYPATLSSTWDGAQGRDGAALIDEATPPDLKG